MRFLNQNEVISDFFASIKSGKVFREIEEEQDMLENLHRFDCVEYVGSPSFLDSDVRIVGGNLTIKNVTIHVQSYPTQIFKKMLKSKGINKIYVLRDDQNMVVRDSIVRAHIDMRNKRYSFQNFK